MTNQGIKMPMALFRQIKDTNCCRENIIRSQYAVYVITVLYFEYEKSDIPITITLNEIWNKYHSSKCTQTVRNNILTALEILEEETFIKMFRPNDNRQPYTIYLDEMFEQIDELYFWLSKDDFTRSCNELTTKELWLYIYLLSTINLQTHYGFVGYEHIHEKLGMSKHTYYKSIQNLQDKHFLVYTDKITTQSASGQFTSVNRAYCRFDDMTYLEDAYTNQVLYSKKLMTEAKKHGTHVIIDLEENARIDAMVEKQSDREFFISHPPFEL